MTPLEHYEYICSVIENVTGAVLFVVGVVCAIIACNKKSADEGAPFFLGAAFGMALGAMMFLFSLAAVLEPRGYHERTQPAKEKRE